MTEEEKSYTVFDVIRAECTLEPMICLHCGIVGETTYYATTGDACCEACGRWQLDEAEDVE